MWWILGQQPDLATRHQESQGIRGMHEGWPSQQPVWVEHIVFRRHWHWQKIARHHSVFIVIGWKLNINIKTHSEAGQHDLQARSKKQIAGNGPEKERENGGLEKKTWVPVLSISGRISLGEKYLHLLTLCQVQHNLIDLCKSFVLNRYDTHKHLEIPSKLDPPQCQLT